MRSSWFSQGSCRGTVCRESTLCCCVLLLSRSSLKRKKKITCFSHTDRSPRSVDVKTVRKRKSGSRQTRVLRSKVNPIGPHRTYRRCGGLRARNSREERRSYSLQIVLHFSMETKHQCGRERPNAPALVSN